MKIYTHPKNGQTRPTREKYEKFSLDNSEVYFYGGSELRPKKASSERDIPEKSELYFHQNGKVYRQVYPPVGNLSRFKKIYTLPNLAPEQPFNQLATVHFEGHTGISTGFRGECILTNDGGDTWESISDRLPNVGNSHILYCNIYNDIILLGGWDNKHYISQDRGETFSLHDIDNANQRMWNIKRQGDIVIIVGHQLNNVGRVVRSTDSGLTWQFVETGITSNISGLHMDADGTVIITGVNSNISISRDFGNTWEVVDTGIESPNNISFFSLTSVVRNAETETIIICSNDEVITRSLDDGITWETINITPNGDFSAVTMLSPSVAVVFGFGQTGNSFISIDSGSTWRNINLTYVIEDFKDQNPSFSELPVSLNMRGAFLDTTKNKLYVTAIWSVLEAEIFDLL